MAAAPRTLDKNGDGSWALWETLATDRPEFGTPASFDGDVERSLWVTFTVTCTPENRFFKMVEEFSGKTSGTGALVTFKESSCLMSIVLAYQPHFRNQPVGASASSGRRLVPRSRRRLIKQKMRDWTGAEILEELLYHLTFSDELPEMSRTANCISVMMPCITSQLMLRAIGDHPKVLPEGYTNLALTGQFAEIPEGAVCTFDYSVRTATIAVYRMLGITRRFRRITKAHMMCECYSTHS